MSRKARRGSRAGWVLVLALGLSGAGPSGAGEPAADAVLAELPILAATEPNRVVIDLAASGGRPLRVLLDTGASHSYATPRAARELGLSVRRLKSSPYRRKTVLGRDLQLLVDTSSSDTAARTGWEYVFLGGDFLSRYVVEIDFHAVRVRFLDPERYQVPERASDARSVVLGFQLHGNTPTIEAEVDGTTMPFLLDTGAQGTAILSGRWAERAKVASDPDQAFEGETVYGSVRLEPARVGRLLLGSFQERDVPVLVAPRGFQNQAGRSDSVIGVEVLRRFVVRFDYPRRRLWLHDPLAGGGREDAAPAP